MYPYDEEYKQLLNHAINNAIPPDGEFVDFCGYECDEDVCGGWDGVSPRCDCGDRRVYWNHYMTNEDKVVVYATAD